MELSVSNDFISLFIPEQSEFNTEDLLNEFKIYIFRLMNITVDSLIQEQVNNDFENSELKSKYKDFFSERIESVLKINELYNEIITKSNIIKNSLEKNIKTIEQNKNTFEEKNINKDIEKCVNDIKTNKLILKDNSIFNLLSIPNYMIDCFYHEEYDIYLEYFNYINNIISEHPVIKNIQMICRYINDFFIKLINNLLIIGYTKFNIEPDILFDFLQLKLDSEIFNNSNLEINKSTKALNCYLYEIKQYMDNYSKNNTKNKKIYFKLLSFLEEKICLIIKENDKEIINKILEYIFDKYIYALCKNIFETNEMKDYIELRDKIINFLCKININDNSKNVEIEVDSITKKYYYSYLDYLLNTNELNIQNYLLMIKDIKKFFAAIINLPNANSLNNNIINNLKYELLFIIYNNLCTINNLVTSENFVRHKDIVNTLIKLNNHCNNIIDILLNFFNDNLFIFRLNKEYEKEFYLFKDKLMLNVIKYFLNDIYNFFNISKEIIDLSSEKKLDNLIKKNII